MTPPTTPTIQQPIQTIAQIITNLQMLVDNGMPEMAQQRITKNGYKLEILNGKVIHSGESTDAWLDRFITQDSKMLALKEDIRKLSPNMSPVLVTGETGTGKEILARALHGNRGGKFIAINCAGLPSELIESELFGHMRGAFTGADNMKVGLMKIADNGTMFLDEIGELPIGVQGKLLRALQERKIRKVGSNAEEDITCRFVCATHRNLRDMVESNTFRMDLYARLSTFELHTLPLRERPLDIPLIVESLPGGKEFYPHVTGKPIDITLNVRSLQQHVERYKVLGKLPLNCLPQ